MEPKLQFFLKIYFKTLLNATYSPRSLSKIHYTITYGPYLAPSQPFVCTPLFGLHTPYIPLLFTQSNQSPCTCRPIFLDYDKLSPPQDPSIQLYHSLTAISTTSFVSARPPGGPQQQVRCADSPKHDGESFHRAI